MQSKSLRAVVAVALIFTAAQIPARAAVYISALFNNGGARLYTIDLDNSVAESFITGTAPGYTLDSIQITGSGLDTSSNLVFSIYSNNSLNGTPGLNLFTLSGANPSSGGTYTFTPSSTALLDPSTQYWIVASTTNAGTYDWIYPGINTLTTTAGWSLNTNDAVATALDGAWTATTNPYLYFDVSATALTTAVPEPSTFIGGALSFLACCAMIVRRRMVTRAS